MNLSTCTPIDYACTFCNVPKGDPCHNRREGEYHAHRRALRMRMITRRQRTATDTRYRMAADDAVRRSARRTTIRRPLMTLPFESAFQDALSLVLAQLDLDIANARANA
jgi:hypothetical protein